MSEKFVSNAVDTSGDGFVV